MAMRKLANLSTSNFEETVEMSVVRSVDNFIQDDYSIMAIKRGDCTIGYKIRHNPSGRFKGARLYTIEAAREMREFYRKHITGYCIDYEIVE